MLAQATRIGGTSYSYMQNNPTGLANGFQKPPVIYTEDGVVDVEGPFTYPPKMLGTLTDSDANRPWKPAIRRDTDRSDGNPVKKRKAVGFRAEVPIYEQGRYDNSKTTQYEEKYTEQTSTEADAYYDFSINDNEDDDPLAGVDTEEDAARERELEERSSGKSLWDRNQSAEADRASSLSEQSRGVRKPPVREVPEMAGGPGGVYNPMQGPAPPQLPPGGSAGRNSVGAPGNNYVINNGKVIFALGNRTSTTLYQAGIAHNCSVPRPSELYSERKARSAQFKKHQLLAPLGTPDCYKAHKGELVYELQGLDGTPQRHVHAHAGYPEVFSCVNGLTIWDQLRFAGFMSFNQDASHSDREGTLMRGGTVSVTHCGPYPIKSGQIVYFSKYSLMTDRGEPGIRESGIPGQRGEQTETGESLAKFKPALFGLRDGDTATFLHGLEAIVKQEWSRAIGGVDKANLDAAGVEALFKRVYNVIYQTQLMTEALELPARHYIEVYVYHRGFLYFQNTGFLGEKLAGKLLFKIIQKRYHEYRTQSIAFLGSYGKGGIPFSHVTLEPGRAAQVDAPEYWASMRAGIFTPATNPEFHDGLSIGATLVEWSRELMRRLQNAHEDFLRSHMVGTAMRDAHPGKTLDIILGYYAR